MKTSYEELADSLKDLISEKGIDYLSKYPYSVYTTMIKEDVSPSLSAAVLVTILASIHMRPENKNRDELALVIREKCLLNDETSLLLADMYRKLFSSDNRREWKERRHEGFRELCSSEWEYSFSGESTWRRNGVHIDCFCDINLSYAVTDPDKLMPLLKDALDNNPFVKAEELCKQIETGLDKVIQDRLDNWVTGDPFHEPYMEDFPRECQLEIEDFFEKYGLKLVDYTCDTDQSDYERDDVLGYYY